jgi:hypothetical protein
MTSARSVVGLRAVPVHTGYGCRMSATGNREPSCQVIYGSAWFGFVPYRLMRYGSKRLNTAIRFRSFLIDGPVTFPSLPFISGSGFRPYTRL